MRRRHLVPLIAGTVAAIALIGGAVATVNMGADSARPALAGDSIDSSRSAESRADRGSRPSEPASPSASPSASPTTSPQVSKTPEATRSPTKKPSSTKAPTGTAVDAGTCKISYYDTGSRTANGESFDPDGLTAAHKTLPFNTRVRVTNLANGKSVIVRINDRGPFVAGRCIDLARGAFVTVASVSAGVINARYEVLK